MIVGIGLQGSASWSKQIDSRRTYLSSSADFVAPFDQSIRIAKIGYSTTLRSDQLTEKLFLKEICTEVFERNKSAMKLCILRLENGVENLDTIIIFLLFFPQP